MVMRGGESEAGDVLQTGNDRDNRNGTIPGGFVLPPAAPGAANRYQPDFPEQ